MKKILLPLLLSFLIVNTLQAKIWRVNNQTGVPADFSNGQAAHNAAAAGDTLYFECSPIKYTNFIIRKQLTVIGVGAYLNTSNGVQTGTTNASFVNIYIKPGGSGTNISGVEVSGIIADTVSNISITRILGQVINLNKVTNSQVARSRAPIYLNDCSIISIDNNIIAELKGDFFNTSNTLISINNNYINTMNIGNATISNNIIENTAKFLNCNVSYNLFAYASYTNNGQVFTTGNNNLFSQSNIIIQTGTGVDDRGHQLKPGSPAIGASSTGGDCGPSGGANPYIFNGMQPAIPSIYKLAVPGVVTGNTMPVIISTRSN